MIKNKIISILLNIFHFILKQDKYDKIKSLINNNTLIIGKGTYGYNGLQISVYRGSEAKIYIGNYTSIGPDVKIITGGIHPIKTVSQYPFRYKLGLKGAFQDGNPYTKGDIKIGSDVWIGTGVTILSGVTIGDGAVISANSLVNKNIPPYAIVAGIPAIVKDYRFNEKQIQELLSIKWWNWDDEKIINNVHLLTDKDLITFINLHLKES